MFGRRFGARFNNRGFRPNFSGNEYESKFSPSNWKPYHHFMFVYVAFRDLKYMEKGNVLHGQIMESDEFKIETSKVTNAAMGWFPEIVLGMNEEISVEEFSEQYQKVIEYSMNTFHNGENTDDFFSQFEYSLKNIKTYLKGLKDKLELVLEDLWDIATVDNELENREREMFILCSNIFEIPINLE